MRFAASPLLVAVALGFLGPAALDAEDEDADEIVSADTPAPDSPDLVAEEAEESRSL